MNSELFLAGVLGKTGAGSFINAKSRNNNSDSSNFMDLLSGQLNEHKAIVEDDNISYQFARTSFSAVERSSLFSFDSSLQSSDIYQSTSIKDKAKIDNFGQNKVDNFERAEKLDHDDSKGRIDDAGYTRKTQKNDLDSSEASQRKKVLEQKELAEGFVSDKDAEGLVADSVSDKGAEGLVADSVSDKDIEELIQQLLPEELLQQLSPEELKTLSESPEEFVNELVALIEQMPESQQKEELLAMVQMEEFKQDVQDMTQALTGSTEGVEAVGAVTANVTDTLIESGSIPTDTQEVHKVSDSSNLQENTDSKALSGEDTVERLGDSQTSESEKVDTKSDKEDKNGKSDGDSENVDAKENVKNELITDKSLRQKFEKLTEPMETPQTSNETIDSTIDSVPEQTQPQAIPQQDTAALEAGKSNAETVAKKIMSLFNQKGDSKNHEVSGVSSAGDSQNKQGMMNGNSGNQNSGFAFTSGSNSNQSVYSRNGTQSNQSFHPIFSDILEKAEYLKTKGGDKVINLEVEQAELGKLKMELSSRDGSVSVRISAESSIAKSRLDELAPQIKEQLMSQGVNLSEIIVDISDRNPDERDRSQMFGEKNKSARISGFNKDATEAIIRKNILPNLRRSALNIKAVDLTV